MNEICKELQFGMRHVMKLWNPGLFRIFEPLHPGTLESSNPTIGVNDA